MGGLDLFQTREEKKKWQRPEALGYPVNGGSDDFGLALDPRQSQHPDTLVLGLFSSTRSGGQGEDDLYRFILRKAPPPPPLYRLEGDIVEAILADPEDPASAVAEYKALPDASLVLTDASAGQELGALALDKTGRFTAELGPATEYRLRASRDGYFNVSETATTIGLPETPGDTFTVTARLVMARIPARNKDITLEDIYYDFDDTTLRAESFPSLAKLTKLLAENPTLRVEIGSHTDSRGEKPYNQRLSRGRANSVVAYLERQGIAPVRMEAKGYGETRLLNRCLDGVSCTEEEHQRNRRTTFKVLGEIELESLPPDEIEVDPRRRGR
jgi:outer membrane protein OmpA-like peptidoglycan-associated protein